MIADASVVVKWCAPFGERGATQATLLLEGHLAGEISVGVLDLTLYEVGNALTKKGVSASGLTDALELLDLWELRWLSLTAADDLARAADLIEAYDLSFYDASYLAVAEREDLALVTDDRALLSAAQEQGRGLDLMELL